MRGLTRMALKEAVRIRDELGDVNHPGKDQREMWPDQ